MNENGKHGNDSLVALVSELLRRVLWAREPAPVARWRLVMGTTEVFFEGEFQMNVHDDSPPLLLSVIAWRDAKGKLTNVDPNEPVAFASSDENLFKITQNADGKPQVEIGPMEGVDTDPTTGVIGQPVVISGVGDADLGEGKKPVTAVGSLILLPAGAVTGEIGFQVAAVPQAAAGG